MLAKIEEETPHPNPYISRIYGKISSIIIFSGVIRQLILFILIISEVVAKASIGVTDLTPTVT